MGQRNAWNLEVQKCGVDSSILMEVRLVINEHYDSKQVEEFEYISDQDSTPENEQVC